MTQEQVKNSYTMVYNTHNWYITWYISYKQVYTMVYTMTQQPVRVPDK